MVPLYRIVGSMVPLDPKFRLCLNRHVFTDVYFTDESDDVRRTLQLCSQPTLAPLLVF